MAKVIKVSKTESPEVSKEAQDLLLIQRYLLFIFTNELTVEECDATKAASVLERPVTKKEILYLYSNNIFLYEKHSPYNLHYFDL